LTNAGIFVNGQPFTGSGGSITDPSGNLDISGTLTAARFTNKAGSFVVNSTGNLDISGALTATRLSTKAGTFIADAGFQISSINRTRVLMLGTSIDVSTNIVQISNNTNVSFVDSSDINLNSGSVLNARSGSALDLSSGSALNARFGSSLNLSPGSALSWSTSSGRSVTLGPTTNVDFTNLTAKNFICTNVGTLTPALSIQPSTQLPLVTIGSMDTLSGIVDAVVMKGNIYVDGDIKFTGRLQGQGRTKPTQLAISPIPTNVQLANKINEIIAYL
jgi:hypothetical protein